MKKTRKQIILDNDLSIPAIMAELETYKTGKQKAKFLREMGQLNLPYDIKWENLAQCHEGTKSWPVYKINEEGEEEKQENILSDSAEVLQGMDDKPLTKEELEALI
jgi:hypothetical protein|tara:strand:+ start:184 stop:501 length:318 start_codon:yes stop_codon:yes gene_type:complete